MNDKHIRQALALIWEQLRHHPILLTLMIVTILIDSSIYIAEPYILKLFVDSLSAAPNEATYHQAIRYVLILGGSYLLSQVVFHIGARSLLHAQIELINRLYKQAYHYIQSHAVRFFADNYAGAIVKRISRAITAAESMMDEIWFTFFPVSTRLVLMSGILLFYSLPLFFVLIIGIGVFVGFTFLMLGRWAQYERKVTKSETELTGILVDAIANNTTVKSFAKEDFELQHIGKGADKLKFAQVKSWNYFWTHLNFPQGMIWTAFLVCALLVSIWLWNERIFSLGDIIFVQTYLISLGPLLWQAVNRLHTFKQDTVHIAELTELLHVPHEIIDAPKAKKLSLKKGGIEFKNASFAYEKSEVFKDLNFVIEGGAKTAFVGHSGSGKSTLIKLLFRFYDIQSGSILIDGQDIAQVKLQSLRSQIGMVPQDPLLFHRTIRENIAYGQPKATQKDIEQAAKKAHAHEFIKKLPDGYNTLVGERGIKLSGGERQRVAIARAFLQNAPIIIFDEATSSLDSISEHYIQQALDVLMKNRTVIVIAHRLSTVVKMDRIIVLDEGKLIESGTHQELVKQSGVYQTLWSMQTEIME